MRFWRKRKDRPLTCTYDIRARVIKGELCGTLVTHEFLPEARPGRNLPGLHYVPIGPPLGKRLYVMCPRHFRRHNRRFRADPRREPEWRMRFLAVGNRRIDWAMTENGVITVTPELGWMPAGYVVYVVQHEFLHWVLERDLGLVASAQLDLLHRRHMRCLGGHSLETFLAGIDLDRQPPL